MSATYLPAATKFLTKYTWSKIGIRDCWTGMVSNIFALFCETTHIIYASHHRRYFPSQGRDYRINDATYIPARPGVDQSDSIHIIIIPGCFDFLCSDGWLLWNGSTTTTICVLFQCYFSLFPSSIYLMGH